MYFDFGVPTLRSRAREPLWVCDSLPSLGPTAKGSAFAPRDHDAEMSCRSLSQFDCGLPQDCLRGTRVFRVHPRLAIRCPRPCVAWQHVRVLPGMVWPRRHPGLGRQGFDLQATLLQLEIVLNNRKQQRRPQFLRDLLQIRRLLFQTEPAHVCTNLAKHI